MTKDDAFARKCTVSFITILELYSLCPFKSWVDFCIWNMGSIPSFHMCEQRLSSAVLIKEHPFTLHVLLFFVEDYFIKMCRYMLALHYVVIFQPLCFSHVFPLFQLDSFIIQCILTKIYPSSYSTQFTTTYPPFWAHSISVSY